MYFSVYGVADMEFFKYFFGTTESLSAQSVWQDCVLAESFYLGLGELPLQRLPLQKAKKCAGLQMSCVCIRDI